MSSDPELVKWQAMLRDPSVQSNLRRKCEVLIEIGKIHKLRRNWDAAKQIFYNALSHAEQLGDGLLQIDLKRFIEEADQEKFFSAQITDPTKAKELPGASRIMPSGTQVMENAQYLTLTMLQSPEFWALLKEMYEKNPMVQELATKTNIILHILPDNKKLTDHLTIVLHLLGVQLTPHLLEDRCPPYHLPDSMIVPLSTELLRGWQGSMEHHIKWNILPQKYDWGMNIVRKMLLLLCHVAIKFDAGTSSSLELSQAVRIGENSEFWTKSYPNTGFQKKLCPTYFHGLFQQNRPRIVGDSEMANLLLALPQWFSGTMRDLMTAFFAEIKVQEIFSTSMPIKLILKWAYEIANLLLSGLTDDRPPISYLILNDLILYNLMDPTLLPPFLTPKGRILRDFFLRLGVVGTDVFAGVPIYEYCQEQLTIETTTMIPLGSLDLVQIDNTQDELRKRGYSKIIEKEKGKK